MRKSRFLTVAVLCGVFAVPSLLFAQNLSAVGGATGLVSDLPTIIGRLIQIVLSLLGVVLLLLMIYSGYLWMTAGGDDEKVNKAKRIMTQAVIGFVIIIASFAITTFILNALGLGTFGFNKPEDTGPGIPPHSNSLGNGGIIDHYPARDEIGVPRNARIIVTFKGIVSPEEFIAGYNDGGTVSDTSDDTISGNPVSTSTPLLDQVVKISRLDGAGEKVFFTGAQVNVGFSIIETPTIETSTYVFMVPDLDGEIPYNVFLSDSIKGKVNGKNASLIDNGGYEWSFTTSDKLDLTPPKVQSVMPANESPDRSGPYGRNIAIQVTFNEPMDPTSVSGMYSTELGDGKEFNNIVVNGPAPTMIGGVFALSNGYRTVTYLTSDKCGVNSCGQDIYCLPSEQLIDVLIKSPNPLAEGPAKAAYPAYGVTDVVGNALDGNEDGHVLLSEDDTLDDYVWGFSTNNQIVRSGPGIVSVEPTVGDRNNVDLVEPLNIVFNDVLLASSLLSQSVYLTSVSGHDLWFRKELDTVGTGAAMTHTVHIPHGVFAVSVGAVRQDYILMGVELIQNQYQNCLSPAAGPSQSSATDGNAVCTYAKNGFEKAPVAANCCIPTESEPYCCDGGAPQATACTTRL